MCRSGVDDRRHGAVILGQGARDVAGYQPVTFRKGGYARGGAAAEFACVAKNVFLPCRGKDGALGRGDGKVVAVDNAVCVYRIAAFDWLDEEHRASRECWSDYRQKLERWYANRARFTLFLENFAEFKKTAAPWVKDPAYIAACMHKAGAPCHYRDLNYPVDAKTAIWAVTNCHLMRKRFSVIDLLNYCGVWDNAFVQKLTERAAALDAGV